ncbi:unnamed protein product [Rotaria sp. Silwood2]|nr:unnamed protein product [Rotaria sp. Silwood2]CAF4508009.1 unnamed protein product [Rotaria sp. Silwood2]
MLDTVMLMCQGRCLYHGSPSNVVPYFSPHGYECEPNDNPGDFALDVLIDVGQNPNLLTKLNGIYNTTWQSELPSNAQRSNVVDSENSSLEQRRDHTRKGRSFLTEIFYLSQRTIRNNRRNPHLPISQIGISIVLSVLVGLLFFDLNKTTESGVQNRLGAIFFIILSQIFINVTALDTLLKQRALFIHVGFLLNVPDNTLCLIIPF